MADTPSWTELCKGVPAFRMTRMCSIHSAENDHLILLTLQSPRQRLVQLSAHSGPKVSSRGAEDTYGQHVRQEHVSTSSRAVGDHGPHGLLVSIFPQGERPLTQPSVPAETAEFKLHDSVLGRLSNDGKAQ